MLATSYSWNHMCKAAGYALAVLLFEGLRHGIYTIPPVSVEGTRSECVHLVKWSSLRSL